MTYETKQKFNEYLDVQRTLSDHKSYEAETRAYYKVYGFIEALEELGLITLAEAADLFHTADDVINA